MLKQIIFKHTKENTEPEKHVRLKKHVHPFTSIKSKALKLLQNIALCICNFL